MTVVIYIVAVVVILALCALGLSIGLLLKNKPLTSCGRASMAGGQHDIACPVCGSTSSDCKAESQPEKKSGTQSAHRGA